METNDGKPRKTTLATGFGGTYNSRVESLSLDKLVNQVPSATFYMRVSGDNKGAEIGNGDIAVVDRSLDPRSDCVVVAILDSELVLRRYILNGEKVELYRDDDKPSEIINKEDFEIWGVVTHSLKSHWPVNA